MDARQVEVDDIEQMGELTARHLTVRVDPEGVVLGDDEFEVLIDDEMGSRLEAAVAYERAAGVFLARAAELRKPPIPLYPRPGEAPPHWT
jgi:hypothetical protein